MEKFGMVFLKGLLLGLMTGLCLAGLAGLLYRLGHGPGTPAAALSAYFFLVGGTMGSLAGWALSLHFILLGLMDALVRSVARLFPLEEGTVTAAWCEKVRGFMEGTARTLPAFLRKAAGWLLLPRLSSTARIERALRRSQERHSGRAPGPERLASVALFYFLEPLWTAFYGVYAMLFSASLVLWGLPFLR